MARIRRHKRTPHMPCKSHSLDSTGRSRFRRVEQGEEVNSNRPGVTPEYPYLCSVCGERYKVRREFLAHLKFFMGVGRRRRQRQSDDPPLDEGPSEPPIEPLPEPEPPQPPQPQPQHTPLSQPPLEPHLTECVADSWYLPPPQLQHQPQSQPQQQPQPEPEPRSQIEPLPEPKLEPNLEFEPLPQPQPLPQGGLTTRMFFLVPRVPPAFQDFLDQTNGRRANNGPRSPRVDLTLRLALKARRGRPRRRLVPLSPIGPIRRFLWFKEYVNKLRLSGGDVDAILGVAGNDVDEIMANSFQTLTDEQLKLKLGI